MDLWQLHIFSKVIEQKSFTKAGQAVFLSQPTVSAHIKELEQFFGLRLVDRLGKEAVPTKAGELLYQYAQKLLVLKEETESALAQFQGTLKGNLCIGGSTIPGDYILPQIIGKFTNEYPNVKISLHIADSFSIIQSTLDGHLELSIVGTQTHHSNTIQTPLLKDEMCLIIPPDHKWATQASITPEMLSQEPFILREKGSGTLDTLMQHFHQADFPVDTLLVVAEMGTTTSVIQSIKNHVGVSILSRIAVDSEIKSGTLKEIPIQGLTFDRHFYLTRHRYRSLSPICRTFVKFLTQHYHFNAQDFETPQDTLKDTHGD